MPTGIFVPFRRSDATSWSWWVNWFNFVRTQPVVHGEQQPVCIAFRTRRMHSYWPLRKRCSATSQWGGVGFCMSGMKFFTSKGYK